MNFDELDTEVYLVVKGKKTIGTSKTTVIDWSMDKDEHY